MITSFMYHLSDSLEYNVLLMDEGHWHKLDNIGSIVSLNSLLIYLLDVDKKTEDKLNYTSLFITMIL